MPGLGLPMPNANMFKHSQLHNVDILYFSFNPCNISSSFKHVQNPVLYPFAFAVNATAPDEIPAPI